MSISKILSESLESYFIDFSHHLSGWPNCKINALSLALDRKETKRDSKKMVVRIRKDSRTLMVLPGGCARICMANGLFGRRGILQRWPRTRGMDRVPTETSSPRGNVPRGINRARLQKKRRRPLCARIRARPGSKIISSGAPAFSVHPLPGFILGATDEKPSLLSRTSPHRSLSLRRGLRARIAIRWQQVRRRQYCVEESFFNFNRHAFFSILQARKVN